MDDFDDDMQDTEARIKLLKYVDSVNELAAMIEKDIKADKVISTATVLALSKFIAAAHEAGTMLEIISDDGSGYSN